jgi:hypothetical protein
MFVVKGCWYLIKVPQVIKPYGMQNIKFILEWTNQWQLLFGLTAVPSIYAAVVMAAV